MKKSVELISSGGEFWHEWEVDYSCMENDKLIVKYVCSVCGVKSEPETRQGPYGWEWEHPGLMGCDRNSHLIYELMHQ